MDIRCGSCNKLFRVADDKISGKGIRFKCSRCGEVITVMRDESALHAPGPAVTPGAAPAPPKPSPPDAAPSLSLHEQQPLSPPSAQDTQSQGYSPPVPPTGMDDFDFSEPHEAAAAGGQQEDSFGGEGFSFNAPAAPTGMEAGSAGEISIPQEEQPKEEAGFEFPEDGMSEPARKPAFTGGSAVSAEEPGPLSEPSAEEQQAPELTMDEEIRPGPATVQAGGAPASTGEDMGIDLGQALAVPKTSSDAGYHPRAWSSAAEDAAIGMPVEPDRSGVQAKEPAETVNPLASGNLTGAIAGLGCALPMVLLAMFAFGLMVRFLPDFSGFPRNHLLAVIGTGLVSLGVMTGVVIAVVQAQAGKKLFVLLNILIGSVFGMVYGAGMNIVTTVASRQELNVSGMIAGAISGAFLAFLLSLLISIARRTILFTKDESFSTALSGLQKAGLALSLAVILVSLYAEGTLIGSMEKAAQVIQQQFEEDVTPEGLSVLNAHGYVDPATGDLIITGTVRNGLGTEKEGWYVETDVFDKDQNVLATVKMLNGVQLFDQRDFDILAKRGRNIDELKAGMVVALQGGTVPPQGSVDFEMRLMNPPQAMASFYPAPKQFSFREQAASDAPEAN